MAILFYSEVDDPQPWREAFARDLPGMAFKVWPDTGNVDDITYALVWKPQPGLLKTLPRLKAILSLGAGVDHVLTDADAPRHLPLVRLVDAGLAEQMSEYALYGVLHFHRNMHRYFVQQQGREWRQLPAVLAADRTVGVMGLGVLGSDFARKLTPLGFRVLSWSRSAKAVDGIESLHGTEGLQAFLRRTEILVNFLPLTAATERILDAEAFARMPRGACIVNLARGGHVDEDALLRALDEGRLGGALLDVFANEPLPAQHRFWQHPKVFMTPHIAGQAIAERAVSQVIANIQRIEQGEAPLGEVDWTRGY